MFVKLAVLACSLAVSLAAWHGPLAGGSPADRFPAGVSPQACPNYPHCNNPAVAANPSAPAHGAYGGYAGAGAYGAPGAWNGNPGAWNQNALDSGEYTGDGDYRGEGLAESGAYGNAAGGAYAGAGPGAYAGGYAGHAAAAVPAGVDPHSCPNYPFCH